MSLVHQQQKQEKKPNQDFPIVCAPCLGDNPYIKMIRYTLHEECKMCHRPFTVYQWKRDKGSRYMKTVICQVCATLKNVCQSCLCDLDFGLPMYARDAIADEGKPKTVIHQDNEDAVDVGKDQGPTGVPHMPAQPKKSNVISLYNAVQAEQVMQEGGANTYKLAGERALTGEQLVNTLRYDPLKNKALRPPEDPTIKTLYISGVEPGRITEQELRLFFEAYGVIKSIKLMPKQSAAFITYNNRSDAELAAANCHKVIIKQRVLKLMWAKPKDKRPAAAIVQDTTTMQVEQQDDESMDMQTILQHKQAIDQHMKDAGIVAPAFLVPPTGFYLAPPPGEETQMYPSMLSLHGASKQ